MQVKIRILSSDRATRSCLVNAYTDALLAKRQQEWPLLAAQLKLGDPKLSDEQALALAQARWPAGAVWNVNIFKDPMPQGQTLVDYLIAGSCGNGDWLELMSAAAQSELDMSEIESMIGEEFSGNVKTSKEAEAERVSAPAELPMLPMSQS